MLINVTLAPILVADHNPFVRPAYDNQRTVSADERTAAFFPFEIAAIVPVSYMPEVAAQCPEAHSVIVLQDAAVINSRSKNVPVLNQTVHLVEAWNWAVNQYLNLPAFAPLARQKLT